MKLVHGGDTVGYREKYGRDALDLSANVSPLGTPEAVARAIGAAAYRVDRYPDPLCRELCAALGEVEGVPKDWILCGNGAADLIFRLALAKRPRHALVLAPTFAEYEAALETVGCDVLRYALDEANDFAMTEDVLGAIQPPVEIVFLCQPNNPTGQAADRALMRRILAKCEAVGALLAVDECFLDFLPDGEALTMKPELAAHRRPVHPQGVHQALRHGGRSAGLRPLRGRGAARTDAARGSAVGGFLSGADGGVGGADAGRGLRSRRCAR